MGSDVVADDIEHYVGGYEGMKESVEGMKGVVIGY
jgi:hypothetical protein